jgi:hypothetical protein
MNSVDLATKIAVEQDGVVSARQCLASGMRWDEITQRCRLGSWRVVFRGVYFIYPEPLVPTRALIRAALLTAGPTAVAVLTSAADLHGLPFLPDDPALHVSVPGELNRLDQPGLLVHQLTIADSDCVTVDGMRATSRVRTVADLILRLSRFDAVALLDGALRLENISTEDLLLVAAMIRGRRGAVKARRRLSEADHRSASPLETRIRLICVDGGLPPEEVQYAVMDENGYVVAVGDLAWPSRRLIVEADGALVHGTASALYHDRRRQNELAARGWTVIRFTWADLSRPGYILTAIRRALAATPPAPSRP